MRRALLLAFPAAAVALLSGCGSDDSGPADSPSATPPTSTPAPSPTESKSFEPATSSAASSAATSAASSVGAAPTGSAIKAGAASSYPAAVGGFEMQSSSGSIVIYRKDGNLVSLSFLSGSKYESISTNVTQQKTVAGTGICGSTSQPTNLTCYLRAADGVYNVSADSGDVPLPELVSFVNQLTAALGTG